MDKLRIGMAIVFCFFSNVIIKVIVLYIENFIKKIFVDKSEKIINITSLFYPFFSLIFIFILAWIYPAIILFRYQYWLNVLAYAAVILMIYHWLFKPIINKFKNIIKNYQPKTNGEEDEKDNN